ncbi:MAG: PilN domain-containing protein [Gammaproteobacteria bacterium]|nr:PilN domain-containing protein [Gammaproteobacteria bacterium]
MSDIRINLLPWRDERREQLKQEFLKVLIMFVFAAIFVLVVLFQFYSISIDTQNERNALLQKEIKVMDEMIEEIGLLKKKKEELLARMRVIQDLQGNRPIIVRIFDQIVRQLAEKVFYTSMTYNGKTIDLVGVADSNNRISTQLRNFEESEWFAKPNVSVIVADPKRGPQASRFTLRVEQVTPKKKGD